MCRSPPRIRRVVKNRQMQDARFLRSEAYFLYVLSDEGISQRRRWPFSLSLLGRDRRDAQSCTIILQQGLDDAPDVLLPDADSLENGKPETQGTVHHNRR